MNWQLPPEYIEGYLAACKKAATDYEAFKVFRQDQYITTIIENGNEEIAGKTALKLLTWRGMSLLNAYLTSEKVGDPILYEGISPTTIRYIYILSLLDAMVDDLFTSPKYIVEIGGGYGGLCKIIHDAIKPTFYSIYDLGEAQELQQRFTRNFGIEVHFPMSQRFTKPHDILIAWCSWSELDLETRKSYLPMIANAQHILFCCNYNYEEDIELIRSVHPDVKEYSDNLYTNIIYK